MTQEVLLNRFKDGVFEIVLNRSERMNALGRVTVAALVQAVAQAKAQHARVLLLRGHGRAFCSRADLKVRHGMDLAARLAHNAGIRTAIEAFAKAPCATVAVLNGVAYGGGLELAPGCDFRFAAAGTTLALTESRVRVLPGAGATQRLPRLIGATRAMQLMFSAEPVSAEWAHSISLVNEVHPADSLQERALDFAELLATRSAPALAAIKRLVNQGMELPLDAALQVERAASFFSHQPTMPKALAACAERRPRLFAGIADQVANRALPPT